MKYLVLSILMVPAAILAKAQTGDFDLKQFERRSYVTLDANAALHETLLSRFLAGITERNGHKT